MSSQKPKDKSLKDPEECVMLKYCRPSRFDYAPEGTVVKVNSGSELHTNVQLYIQISPYQDVPNWVSWGEFLGLVYRERAFDKKFIDTCMKLFKE